MKLLGNYFVKYIINVLEKEFLSHLPEMQKAFLDEVTHVVKVVSDWIESKNNLQGESKDEKENSQKVT